MIAIIKGIVVEIPVTSVWLQRDITDPQGYNLKMFFCPNCQNPLIQYKGNVIQIVPGEGPYKVGTVLQCKNCKSRYMFHDVL